MNTDLFPETLLVSQEAGRIFTTSVHVAEHFGKRHDNVMKVIRKAIEESPEEERLLNFEESLGVFVSSNGAKRPRKICRLTHDGFMFVAQGFTGAEAAEWKWKFIRAFRDMERQLAAHREREASALYMLRPLLKPVIDGTLAGESRAAIGARIDRSPASITYHRRVARTLDLLGAQ
jgi:Rha family phage regulatory protein